MSILDLLAMTCIGSIVATDGSFGMILCESIGVEDDLDAAVRASWNSRDYHNA
jgi:hypothetical protein